MARDWEQLTGRAAFAAPRAQPARIRRLLRRGPRVQAPRPRAPLASGPGTAADGATAPGAVTEWHYLTPGEQTAAWASLRAWVTWLHDRYELSVEDRLPRCWASHPGLVEELTALKAWREEIYAASQPSGQAARYWHAELRQVLHAATTQYALGCRTGHRGPAETAADNPGLRGQWAAADPLARVPGTELAAGAACRAGGLVTSAAIGAALDAGGATALPGGGDTVFYQGTWWMPVSAGWATAPEPERPGLPSAPPWATQPGAPHAAEGEPDPWKA